MCPPFLRHDNIREDRVSSTGRVLQESEAMVASFSSNLLPLLVSHATKRVIGGVFARLYSGFLPTVLCVPVLNRTLDHRSTKGALLFHACNVTMLQAAFCWSPQGVLCVVSQGMVVSHGSVLPVLGVATLLLCCGSIFMGRAL